MTITLDNVLPIPLASRSIPATSLWRQRITFTPGQAVCVTAPSGAGKTTLLQVLYGLRRDYTGTCRLDGRDVRELMPRQWALLRRQRLAMVFQDLRLLPTLTVGDNLRLQTELAAGDIATHELASALGLGDLLATSCGSLSQGERQRVAIARALAQPFDWLFLDEAFSHLDAAWQQRAAALIKSVCAARGAGLINSSLDGDRLFEYHCEWSLE
jgi:ABC-type lipoprotein export system ATPase subunit